MEKARRKKEKRPVSKGAALLTLLCIGALLGAAAYFLRPEPPVPDAPPAAEEEAPRLLSRPMAEIEEIVITPREGEAWRLQQKDGAFFFPEAPDTPLRTEVTEEIRLMTEEMTANMVVSDDAEDADLTRFGLLPPALTLTVSYTDGEERTVLLGDRTAQEIPQRYVMARGDKRIFTVLEAECQIFFRQRDYLRAFDQPRIDGTLLDEIRVEGEKTLTLSYTAAGWHMDAPYAYAAAGAKINSLLNKIQSMAFEMCLGDGEETDLAAYGLDAPALAVTLTQAPTVIRGETAEGEEVAWEEPAREYSLLIGDETGRSGVYVLWEGKVFVASNFLLGFWKELAPSDLLSRQPVTFSLSELSGIVFSRGDSETRYRVTMVESVTENNQIAVDEYGQTLYTVEVTREGEEEQVALDRFIAWYAEVSSLRAAGDLPDGYVPSGEKDAILTVTAGGVTRELAFYPFDALHDALAVDGEALFYVNRDWLEKAEDTP